MNKIFLSGNLTRDVEFCRRQPTVVAKSAIAVHNPLSDDVASMPLIAFDETAELMSNLLARDFNVLIEGQLLIFHVKNNGGSDTAVSVLVEHFYFPGDQFDTTA